MEKKFNNFEELVENITRGGEIEFIFDGHEYCILPIEEGILVSEQHNDISEVLYKTPADVGEYIIADHKLKDIIHLISVTFRCF